MAQEDNIQQFFENCIILVSQNKIQEAIKLLYKEAETVEKYSIFYYYYIIIAKKLAGDEKGAHEEYKALFNKYPSPKLKNLLDDALKGIDKVRANSQKVTPNVFTSKDVVLSKIDSSRFDYLDIDDKKTANNIKFSPNDEIKIGLKNVYAEQNISEANELKNIKEKISKWSNNIPHHDLKNLGDKIELLSVVERPSYFIKLHIQYEKRILNRDRQPYKGETIPEKIFDENNIDIWTFKPEWIETKSKDFEFDKNKYVINGTQEKLKCEECEGLGKITCSTCKGTKKIKCPKCKGRSVIDCWSCNGRGRQEVKIRKHNDYYDYEYKEEICPRCKGDGKIPCPNNCDVDGKVKCHTCIGYGMVLCSDCEGEGWFLSYLYFDDIFKPFIKSEIINHPHLPSEINAINTTHIYNINKTLDNDFKGMDKEVNDIVFDEILKGGIISTTTIESLPNQNLKVAILRLASSAPDTKEFKDLGLFGIDYRILSNRLIIGRINATIVNYHYNKKSYSLWLIGKDKLFAPKSPISEITDNYFSLAQKSYGQKDYLSSLNFANKIIEMDSKSKEGYTLKKKILFWIWGQYLLGGIGGGIITGIILGLIENYISGVSLIQKEIPIFISFYGCITGFIVGLLSAFLFQNKIKESKKRIFYPLGVSTVLTIILGVEISFAKILFFVYITLAILIVLISAIIYYGGEKDD